ncbi:MAG: iron-sulfur cluster assembly accessory protein [Myxococcota bacterium]
MAELNILDQTPATGTLTITAAGAEGVKKFLKENNAPEGSVMRVGVRGGGCSGLSYVLEYDVAPARPDDIVLEVHGVVVRVDKRSMKVLAGTTLDYKVGLMDAGFRFDNPRAIKTCGCGESFSIS